MGKYGPEKIRTLALVGHGGSGKTSLAEALLFDSGATSRMGRVDDGTAKTDYDPDEIHRKISINSVPIFAEWKDCELNVMDTPGFVDFLPDVYNVLRAMDAAVLVVNGQNGLEAQTEKLWDFCDELELPMLCIVNKLDKENADFDKVLDSLRNEFGSAITPFVVPIGAAAELKGVVDLLGMQAYTYSGETGKFEEGPIDSSMESYVQEKRDALIEAAASADDALTEKYLEGEELSPEEIVRGIRAGVIGRKLVPVIAGSAVKNIGINKLMDLMVQFLPAPTDRKLEVPLKDKEAKVTVTADPAGDPCGYVFKVLAEAHLGEMTLLRVYNGTVTSGSHLYNTTRDEREKVGAIARLRGKERTDATELVPGQIGTLLKVKSVHFGDTLATEKVPFSLPPPKKFETHMSVALRPASAQDTEKLSTGLSRLRGEDPFIRAENDEVTHEFVVSGTGEIHVDTFVKKLRDRFHVNVETAKPKIPYRETVRGKAEGQGKHKKQSGGHGQYGDCWLRIEPLPTGTGFEFVDAIVGGKIPNKFIPAVEKGVRESLVRGILAGYPVTDFRCTVYEGSYHAVDSSEMAFKTAASKGFKLVARKANPILMEPIMNVTLMVPEGNMGDVMGDLNGRRGRILGMEPLGKRQVIKAQVPLSEMYKYIITLRSITGGRGEYTMEVSHYEEVPATQADHIIKESGGVAEDED